MDGGDSEYEQSLKCGQCVAVSQRPNSTHLEGMRSWNELGRSVRPGEKGIRIFAPAIGVKPDGQVQDASKTSRKRKKQEPETQLLGFRAVSVFDRLSRDLRPGLCAPM